MAAKEMWDYFSGTVTADYAAANLTLFGRGSVKERCFYNQKKHRPASGSPVTVTFGTTPRCYLEIPWGTLNESDSGTIYDFYMDPAKAYAISRSFYYEHHDGHTYTVMFDCDMERIQRLGNLHGITVTLEVLGRAP